MRFLRRFSVILFVMAAMLPLQSRIANAAIVNGANWAGHVAPAPNGDFYSQVGCTMVVPVIGQNYHSASEGLSEWCGIGAPNGYIVQAGIYAQITNNQPPVYNIFWEDFPYPQNQYWAVSPGDSVNVQIQMNLSGPNTSDITICDTTKNQCFYQPGLYTPFENYSNAMYVMENTQLNHTSNWLPNFTTAWWSFNWFCGYYSCYNLSGGAPIGHNGNNLYQLNAGCCSPPYGYPTGIGPTNSPWDIPSSHA